MATSEGKEEETAAATRLNSLLGTWDTLDDSNQDQTFSNIIHQPDNLVMLVQALEADRDVEARTLLAHLLAPPAWCPTPKTAMKHITKPDSPPGLIHRYFGRSTDAQQEHIQRTLLHQLEQRPSPHLARIIVAVVAASGMDQWPDLITTLVRLANTASTPIRRGALETLALLVGDSYANITYFAQSDISLPRLALENMQEDADVAQKGIALMHALGYWIASLGIDTHSEQMKASIPGVLAVGRRAMTSQSNDLLVPLLEALKTLYQQAALLDGWKSHDLNKAMLQFCMEVIRSGGDVTHDPRRGAIHLLRDALEEGNANVVHFDLIEPLLDAVVPLYNIPFREEDMDKDATHLLDEANELAQCIAEMVPKALWLERFLAIGRANVATGRACLDNNHQDHGAAAQAYFLGLSCLRICVGSASLDVVDFAAEFIDNCVAILSMDAEWQERSEHQVVIMRAGMLLSDIAVTCTVSFSDHEERCITAMMNAVRNTPTTQFRAFTVDLCLQSLGTALVTAMEEEAMVPYLHAIMQSIMVTQVSPVTRDFLSLRRGIFDCIRGISESASDSFAPYAEPVVAMCLSVLACNEENRGWAGPGALLGESTIIEAVLCLASVIEHVPHLPESISLTQVAQHVKTSLAAWADMAEQGVFIPCYLLFVGRTAKAMGAASPIGTVLPLALRTLRQDPLSLIQHELRMRRKTNDRVTVVCDRLLHVDAEQEEAVPEADHEADETDVDARVPVVSVRSHLIDGIVAALECMGHAASASKDVESGRPFLQMVVPILRTIDPLLAYCDDKVRYGVIVTLRAFIDLFAVVCSTEDRPLGSNFPLDHGEVVDLSPGAKELVACALVAFCAAAVADSDRANSVFALECLAELIMTFGVSGLGVLVPRVTDVVVQVLAGRASCQKGHDDGDDIVALDDDETMLVAASAVIDALLQVMDESYAETAVTAFIPLLLAPDRYVHAVSTCVGEVFCILERYPQHLEAWAPTLMPRLMGEWLVSDDVSVRRNAAYGATVMAAAGSAPVFAVFGDLFLALVALLRAPMPDAFTYLDTEAEHRAMQDNVIVAMSKMIRHVLGLHGLVDGAVPVPMDPLPAGFAVEEVVHAFVSGLPLKEDHMECKNVYPPLLDLFVHARALVADHAVAVVAIVARALAFDKYRDQTTRVGKAASTFDVIGALTRLAVLLREDFAEAVAVGLDEVSANERMLFRVAAGMGAE